MGHSGGLLGVPEVLLAALGGLIAFLGRSGSGFRENPGDSGSHFGFILDHFFCDFSYYFSASFFDGFLCRFFLDLEWILEVFFDDFLIFFVVFVTSRKCEK